MGLKNFLLNTLYRRIATLEERKIVLENFVSLTTLQALGYLLPILILPYLWGIIGAEKFGLICFAQAFVQYFLLLTDFGFGVTATKEISLAQDHKEKTSRIFSEVLAAKLILACFSLIIFVGLLNFIPKFRRDWLVYIFSFGTVIGSSLFPVWFFQGKEKMKYITAVNSLGGILYAIFIFTCIRNPQDYIYIPLLNSLFSILGGIIGLYIAFARFDIDIVPHTASDIQRQLKAGWKVFISSVAINAYTASRVFAVGLLTNNVLTGYYSVAERIAGIIQTFPLISFSQAVYPRINKIYRSNKEHAIRILHKIQRTSTAGFFIFLPIAFIFAPLIIKLICGIAQEETVLTLRLLLSSILFVGGNAFPVQLLLVAGKTDLYARLHVTAALIGIPLLFLFIYFFSIPGAALATILIEAGIFFATRHLIKKYL